MITQGIKIDLITTHQGIGTRVSLNPIVNIAANNGVIQRGTLYTLKTFNGVVSTKAVGSPFSFKIYVDASHIVLIADRVPSSCAIQVIAGWAASLRQTSPGYTPLWGIA